jgi:outer membrane porin, OprD family
MKKNSFLKLIILLFTPLSIKAQNHATFIERDTCFAQNLHNRGHFSGKIRQFSMATTNHGQLTDQYALAIGGGLHYESPVLFRFLSAELGGMFIFNLKSSELGKPDTTTRAKDRYEIGLFDLEEPENRTDLDRMDEFNLRFHLSSKSRLIIGRQVINSPLINPQDGRMRPSMLSGAWLNVKGIKKTELQGGWLWAAAPRSTVRWFSVAESIGVYANGTTPTGTAANYAKNIESKGVFVVGGKNRSLKNTTFTAWNYWIENVNNTFFFQTDYEHTLSNAAKKWHFSAQIIRQEAINDGGNADPTKSFVQKGEQVWILGGRAGFSYKKHQFLTNLTRITEGGRFLFPREWGRDPLLTFMQRERNEGAGNVWAVNTTHTYQAENWQSFIGLGYYKRIFNTINTVCRLISN